MLAIPFVAVSSPRAEIVDTPVGSVRFVGYEDLLRMQYAAGRGLDLIDFGPLREARGEPE